MENEILPAKGKLGVLTVGMGAVSTTFIAGVIAIRNGLEQPIGSYTQFPGSSLNIEINPSGATDLLQVQGAPGTAGISGNSPRTEGH